MKYTELLKITSLKEYPDKKQIDIIGNLFDFSFDNSNLDGVKHAFVLSEQIEYESLSSKNKILFNYDLSNGYSYLRKLKYYGTKQDWDFQLEEIAKEIFHMRKAISINGFEKIEKERQCQIYTNLGNTFSYIGRFVEAQEYWNKAIKIIPTFSMAIANKGNGLFHYGRHLFDNSHYNLFHLFSFHSLKLGLALKENLVPESVTFFENMFLGLKQRIPTQYHNKLPNLNKFSLGRDKKLKNYRLWALENTLYINPLNDLGNYKIASHDCLNLPSLIFKKNSPPVYYTLFNQIKQEYGSARFMYFESIQRYNPHYSDRDIVIMETGELAKYSYYLELLKASFRIIYSLLDKIAFLLNDYLSLGVPQHDVTFRTIWYEKGKKNVLRQFFVTTENWALRGLFWLSKDLFEKEGDFNTVLEPEAQKISQIRNHIEHKAFKITSDFFPYPSYYNQDEDISFVIPRAEFESKTLKLMKLSRAAIIYLSLAINKEESSKDYSQLKKMNIPVRELAHKNKF